MFGSRRRELARRVADLEAAAAPPGLVKGANTAAAGGGVGQYWFWPGVGRAEAMAVPTLAFIRALLAGGVASMPLERFRKTGPDSADKIDPGWCENPDLAPAIPPSVFWSWLIDDLFFMGKSTLVVIARDAAGFPMAFRRVLPGQLVYEPEMLALGISWAQNPVYYLGQQIDPADVVVVNGPHEGICNYGQSTIQAALDLETGAANAAAEPLPNIDLHQTAGEPLSVDKAGELVASWKAARALGATAYTPQNLEARTLGWSAADQQMVEGRQYEATQLARMAGVNPTLVSAAMGSSSSYVYTNQADYRAAFLDDVLDAYLQAIEGRLSSNDVTPRGQYVAFDRDEFTRIPLLERVQVMVGALRGGATPEAVNQMAEVLDLDFTVPTTPDDQPAPTPPVPKVALPLEPRPVRAPTPGPPGDVGQPTPAPTPGG